ncbi:GSCFA domain-containing protein [Agrobacterium pusense]|uniref:GSCFA domain-containing protein n=1 Tax=Agrobacterium pusense TaxID=648995 RepID=UPI000D1A04E0|nr:GSCFA domain-containing protein [Agrobacterium pusense]
MKIPYATAYESITGNKRRMMESRGTGTSGSERMRLDYPDIAIQPKFKISKEDVFFTIGSCFARNVEIELAKLGVKNITSECIIPANFYELAGVARNGALNAYTPPSMLDLIRLRKAPLDDLSGAVQTDEDEFIDLMVSGIRPLSRNDALALRNQVINTYRRLPEASVVVVTLGYTESWLDTKDNIYVNRSPGANRKLMKFGDRFDFHPINPIETVETLEAIVAEIREATGNSAKVILTVSPVPLGGTWTQRDVITANLISKSTLLAAAATVAGNHEFVDYYPSYELVIYGDQETTWEADGIHVKPARVEKVIRQFAEAYFV